MRIWLAIAAVLALAGAAPAFGQEWAEFANSEDRFSINFPGPPRVSITTYKSQFGAELPARVYAAAQSQSRFSITVVDYRSIERILTEKSKSCPAGAETCLGGSNPASSTGAGYWKADVAGAIVYAAWQFMQRNARVTELIWSNIDLVEGLMLSLANNDATRTLVSIFMHEDKLYIAEATVPPGAPEPGLFQQSLGWIDEEGRPIRYRTLYHHGFPTPARAR